MSEMINRVIEAIQDAASCDVHICRAFSGLSKKDKEAFASSVIEAMREPTNEMHKAMCEAYNSPIAIWDAGIKVALKPATVDA